MNASTLDTVINATTQILIVVVIPILGYYVRRYIQSAQVKDAFDLLSKHTLSAVERLNKTRRELRDPSKPGQWTDEEAKKLRDAALREVRGLLGDSLNILVDHLGSEAKVDRAILNSIDAAAESTRSRVSSGSSSSAETNPVVPVASPSEPASESSTASGADDPASASAS